MITDDRGMFRVYAVSAGRYVVCAEPHFQPGLRATPAAPKRERFVRTCHPAVASPEDAQVVAVDASEVEGIDVRMIESKTFTLSGIVVDANGDIAAAPYVTLIRRERDSPFATASISHDGRFLYRDLAPGQYAVEAAIGNTPGGTQDTREGQYGYADARIDVEDVGGLVVTLKRPATVHGRITFEDAAPDVRQGGPMTVFPAVVDDDTWRRVRVSAASVNRDLSFTLRDLFGTRRLEVQGRPRGWIVKSVHYRGQDITDAGAEFVTDPRHEVEVVLTNRGAIVAGTVSDEAGQPAGAASVVLLPAGGIHTSASALRNSRNQNVQGLPRGWAVKSIRYKGEDITERPTEFVTDPRHQIEILLTSRLAVASGTVTDDSGKPATGAIVLLVHADAAAASSLASRATTRPTLKTGTFEMPGVRAGEYLIVAVPRDYYQSLIQDRLPLQPLLKQAERITLVENDRMKLNLRLVTPDAR